MRRFVASLVILIAGCAAADSAPQQVTLSKQQVTPSKQQGTPAGSGVSLPNKKGSIKFAVIGDSGTGGGAQQRIAEVIAGKHKVFPFEFVIMLGDNLYGSEREGDYLQKFERPYKPLLDAGVKFYAALGNHDDPSQAMYKPFNMNGEPYHSFKPSPLSDVRFFALDSTNMKPQQLEWLEKQLAASGSEWKIAYFHHPLYSSGGRHGSDLLLRKQLEPLFVKYGVDVVFTGHEHFYERVKPQQGITYIISGSAAKLRRGDIERSNLTAKGYDQGYTFMIVEIDGDAMHFQAINERGETVDSGVIHRNRDESARKLKQQ